MDYILSSQIGEETIFYKLNGKNQICSNDNETRFNLLKELIQFHQHGYLSLA